jgi:4-amino-4-deoxy-L-arabinose transferase-like glycosyltransferase
VPLNRAFPWVPAGLVVVGFLCLWPNLGHPSIASWDESGHQDVVRGLFDTGVPTIYRDPLVATPSDDWLTAEVFLHKPTLPFAIGAVMMRFLGVTPLALRSVSFIAALATAMGIYFFGRRLLGTLLAALMAAAFLCLPFGFSLIQGYQFGDVTDCTLVGFVTLSMWALLVAIERSSVRFAALGGALCGCAFLCKSAMGLAPIGVIATLYILGRTRLAARLRLSLAVAAALAAMVVALPWNLYCVVKWPTLFGAEAKFTLGFLTDTGRMFSKPFDSFFDQILQQELEPWPAALFLFSGVWLVGSAWKRRDWRRWFLCLWLWGDWVPLSLAAVKVPAHAWGAAPAALLALGLLVRDSFETPAIAGAVIAPLVAVWAVPALGARTLGLPPSLGVHKIFQGELVMVRSRLTFAVMCLFTMSGFALALGVVLLWPRRVWILRILAGAAAAAVCWVSMVQSPRKLAMERTAHRDQFVESYVDQLGRALDRSIPEKSILFFDAGHDPPCCFEKQSAMFYSGRMAYKFDERLLGIARERQYHPYLVSGISHPFRRVESVPAGSWLQAFDLDAPLLEPGPPPSDITPADVRTSNAHVVGVARAPGDGDRDRYVFYLAEGKLMLPVLVVFSTKDGREEHAFLTVNRTLSRFEDLGKAAWFTMTLPGPARSNLKGVRVGQADLPLP